MGARGGMNARVSIERCVWVRCIGARGRIEPRVASERYVWLRCIGARGRIEPRVASERHRRLRSWSQPMSYQVLARNWRPPPLGAVFGPYANTRARQKTRLPSRTVHAYPLSVALRP